MNPQMKPQPIKIPKFMRLATMIIAEVRARTFIDDVDAEALRELLKEELNEQCRMLDGYYEEEYYNELSRTRTIAYDEGYALGYDGGHSRGYSDGYSEGHSAGAGR